MQVEGLENRPDFWRVRPDEIISLCAGATKCSRKEVICHTPLGYPVYALFYGRKALFRFSLELRDFRLLILNELSLFMQAIHNLQIRCDFALPDGVALEHKIL